METTNSNKIVMGVLGVLLATKALGVFMSAVFYHPAPAKPGYALPAGTEAAAPAAKGPAAPEEPLPALLAKADAAKGQADTKACQACHSFDKGGPSKVGPPLWGVVGRKVASVDGFAYSDSLKAAGGDWSYEALNHWIANPKGMASATKMAFNGEADAHKRADILAYLQTLSESPVPFPK